MYKNIVLSLVVFFIILVFLLGPIGWVLALLVLGPISAITDIKDTFFGDKDEG